MAPLSKWSRAAVALSLVWQCGASTTSDWAANSKSLLTESMDWLDRYYDSDAGYIYDLGGFSLRHDTRTSSWYAAGLLARNEGNDVQEAAKIVKNIISGQFTNTSLQW